MTVVQSAQSQAMQETEYSYKTPSAGLSTDIILASIDSEEITMDLVSVSTVAQANDTEKEAAIEAISESISEIEAYTELAYENAQGYESALAVYEKAADILSQAEEAKASAENAQSSVIAGMYVQEVEDMVAQAAEYADAAKDAVKAAQEEEIQDKKQELVDYALSFVGVTPYRYGGTSLTSGADCSGFTMAIYSHFGYTLPHSSSAQALKGRSVSVSEIEIGDLVCYYGHVGIYIGNGRIVHSPSPGKKVCTTSMYFMKIKSIRRIIE